MTEVLIIGAGPAGSSAAIRLARAGHEVVLADRARFPRPKPCGEYYNPECVRLLAELGVLNSVMRAGARSLDSVVLQSRSGRSLRVPFSELGSPRPALSLGRETLDYLLLEEARRSGAEVWEGAAMREPLREQGQVTGAIIRRDGVDEEVRARITLAADGLRSRFARRLGLGRGDGGLRKFGLTGRCAVRPGAPERLEMHTGGPGCCGIAVRGDVANLGMVADQSHLREMGGHPAAFFQKELERFPELSRWLEGTPETVLTVGPLTWKTQAQSVAGCLLLGDAAGFYDPFTGQGVTFALLTAELAAEVAHAVLVERDVSASRLAEYSRRRSRMLEPRLWVQHAIQWVTARPQLYDRVLGNLRARPDAARSLLAVVADVLPARHAFSPGFVARLLV